MCSGRMNCSARMRAVSTCSALKRERAGQCVRRGGINPSEHTRSRSTSSPTTAKVRACSLVITYFSSASPEASSSSALALRQSGCVMNRASV